LQYAHVTEYHNTVCLYKGESNENLKSAQHNAILCAAVGTSHQHG